MDIVFRDIPNWEFELCLVINTSKISESIAEELGATSWMILDGIDPRSDWMDVRQLVNERLGKDILLQYVPKDAEDIIHSVQTFVPINSMERWHAFLREAREKWKKSHENRIKMVVFGALDATAEKNPIHRPPNCYTSAPEQPVDDYNSTTSRHGQSAADDFVRHDANALNLPAEAGGHTSAGGLQTRDNEKRGELARLRVQESIAARECELREKDSARLASFVRRWEQAQVERTAAAHKKLEKEREAAQRVIDARIADEALRLGRIVQLDEEELRAAQRLAKTAAAARLERRRAAVQWRQRSDAALAVVEYRRLNGRVAAAAAGAGVALGKENISEERGGAGGGRLMCVCGGLPTNVLPRRCGPAAGPCARAGK